MLDPLFLFAETSKLSLAVVSESATQVLDSLPGQFKEPAAQSKQALVAAHTPASFGHQPHHHVLHTQQAHHHPAQPGRPRGHTKGHFSTPEGPG